MRFKGADIVQTVI